MEPTIRTLAEKYANEEFNKLDAAGQLEGCRDQTEFFEVLVKKYENIITIEIAE